MNELVKRVRTIGEAYGETKEFERKGLLKEHLEKLIKNQEEKLGMKHFGVPIFVVTMDIFDKMYEDGRIYIQYLDEKIVYHELGHFYFDRLCKNLGLDFRKGRRKYITKWWEARNHLISEGVATYFEREMSGDEDEFNDSEYPETIEAFLRNNLNFLLKLYYEGGYHLVKPILDISVEKGCKKIALDLPKREEMVKLPEYRKRILRILGESD